MKTLDRWTYRLTGRKIPVLQVIDVEPDGQIQSICLKPWVQRANSLIDKWDLKGAEISPDNSGLITYTDASGLTVPAFVEYKGRTCDLYVQPRTAPNVEAVIGTGAMMDDISEAMDFGKSMRNLLIGLVLGIMLGWWIIGPMATAVFS